MLRGLRVLIGVLVVGSTVLFAPVSAPPAGAAAVCTANASFGYAPAIGVVPAGTTVTGTLVLNCPLLAPDAGLWVLPFATAPLGATESCALGTGAALLGPALVGPAGFAGALVWTHVGPDMGITAVMTWPGNTRNLSVTGAWAPILIPDNCVTIPATSGFFTGAGAFV